MLNELTKNYKKKMIQIAIAWILTSVMVVVFTAFTIVMIEYAVPSKNINLIIELGLIYFGVNVLRAITTFWEDIADESFVKEIEADYREKIYLKLQKTKQEEIDQMRTGAVIENIINDTKEIGRYYGRGICTPIIGGVARLIGMILILMYVNIPIMLIILAIYISGFIFVNYFNKKSIEYTKLKRKTNATITNWSNEQVQGFSTIKSLSIEQERLKEIKKLISKYETVVNKLEKNIRTYTYIYEFIISFIEVVNILIGGTSVEQGIITYGALIILVRYASSPETYAKWFINGFQIRNVCKISYNKVQEILSCEEENITKGKILKNIDNIEFENVSFSYGKNQNTLNNINLNVSKGERIALIGRTGSGKTTLVNLVCRFYDIQDGIIKINGEDYTKYSIQSLRNKIGYIMQKVVLFDGTILGNINYANKRISKERIVEICKKLNLHDKIMQFENGYETLINDETDLFSTGEKQLINFARVMVEDPEIIILDEATASLSYKSEMLVRNAIEEITKGKISFIIAHRLSTIEKCDKIVVMSNGNIIEEGNHVELIEKQGEYYKLLNKVL